MPNRSIDEHIKTDKTINSMSDFLFRLWIHLITYVDDHGRGSADPDIIKGSALPLRKGVTATTINGALANLATMGIVTLYEVDGDPYLCFPKWSEYQRVRTKSSKFPAPEDGKIISPQSAAICGNPRQREKEEGAPLFPPPSLPPTPPITPTPYNPPPEEERESEGARKALAPRTTRFVPPTVDEVRAYCQEKNLSVDPQRFVDFYESKGWMVGKNKMKNWHSAISGWNAREGGTGNGKAANDRVQTQRYGLYL